VVGFINNWAGNEIGGVSEVKTEEVKVENTDNIKEEQIDQPKPEENGEVVNVETINPEDVPKEEKDADYVAPDIVSDEEEEEAEDVPDLDTNLAKNKRPTDNSRSSVSAEVFGLNNQKTEYTPKVVEKTDEVKERISKRLEESFMFSNLDHKEKEIVLNAMEEHKFAKDDVVITQGDDGDVLYCVDSGKLNCFRKANKEDEGHGNQIKTYGPGEAFGELALLYNAPRAATIIAEEDSVCFSLDRDCFNNIVKEATVKRRERFDEFVNKVEILQELDAYERGQLSDCLTTETYNEGDTILKAGETGIKFYMIEEGTANAVQDKDGQEEVVLQYTPNMYFGELALLNDDVRQASIVATSAMTVAWIGRNMFKRLLGPIDEVLKRNAEKYDKFVKAD